jgi:SAM-dependent methyltransferase
MNLLRPTFSKESFDVVICNGVLMTLANEFDGFRSIANLVKPGGYIVIGLYNRWGRLMTDLRRQIFRVTGGRGRWIDPYLRRPDLSDAKRGAWYADQYLHPAEKKHSIGDVQDWFVRCDIDFLRGIPPVTLDGDPLPGAGLFTAEDPGSAFDHGVVQAIQISTGSLEGGFYISIGRKRGGSEPAATIG